MTNETRQQLRASGWSEDKIRQAVRAIRRQEMTRTPLMDANSDNPLEASIARLRSEAVEYYTLCDKARSLGIPTSLDDPRSPKTVEALRLAVAAATREP